MAKTRMINTRFWNDGYIAELEPMAKLLFLYLLTNQNTEMCGAYELSIRTMAFETGIGEDEVRNILSRFGMDGKVDYEDGWVIVRNFLKHQQKNPNIEKGIRRAVEELPSHIKALIAFETDTHLNLNLNSNLNLTGHSHRDWLTNIPPEALKELTEKYEASTSQVKRKAEELNNYCLAKGKVYKNYRAFLENALARDFGRRAPKKELHVEKPVHLDPDAQRRVDELKGEISKKFRVTSPLT